MYIPGGRKLGKLMVKEEEPESDMISHSYLELQSMLKNYNLR